MRLTKRRSLEMCRDMWTWLQKNPSRDKQGWFLKFHINEMPHDCPCCAYVEQYADKDAYSERKCHLCPLYALWGTGKVPYGCEIHPASPFQQWKNTTSRAMKSAAADAIACACADALNTLAKKGK